MTLRLLVCGVLACAAAAGCALAPAGSAPAATTPEPGYALIVGWGRTAGENAASALTGAQGARVAALFVASANAQKVSFGQNVARLAPGNYELTVSCGNIR